MMFYFIFLFIFFSGIVVNGDQSEFEGPRPVRDRFRLMVSNINEQRVEEEITDFTTYKCEKMAVIRNKADGDFRLTCKSHHDSPKTVTIQPGNSFVFTFRPQKSGDSKFWCTVEYKQYVSKFDIYNENSTYMCPREIDEVYQYTVTHEGIFAVGKKDSDGNKIRSLFKGHNKYILWEEYENEETDGFLIQALVDGGICEDIPEQFNDKTAAVTVCSNHCLHLYEHTGCRGKVQTVQATADCIDVPLDADLKDKLSAIKGC